MRLNKTMITRISYCQPEHQGKLVEICGGAGAIDNTKSLGINIGDDLGIISRYNGKGKILVKNEDREISIGYELASKMLIECDERSHITLDNVKVGDTVKVLKMGAQGDIRFRLVDMGLLKGVTIKVIRVAPLGDPLEIQLSGFHLSLRLEEAKCIDVEIVEINRGNGKKRWGLF